MNNLLNTTTMTLKEITDLLEVRHNDAMRTVEKMQQDQSFGIPTKISYVIKRTTGNITIQTYQLDKRQSIAVASRLNTALLMRIIDRWQELETANIAPPPPPKELTPLEIAHNALLTTTKALSDEIEERKKVEKMLEVAKTIELASCASENDISIDEFCKIVTSSLENTNLGRTKCYIIFRAIGLVETQSTRPTQRGMAIYLDYRKHEFGYSTRVIKDKGSKLIKLMIKTLRNNQSLNEALGYPLGDF